MCEVLGKDAYNLYLKRNRDRYHARKSRREQGCA
jgi:hypothetical protein